MYICFQANKYAHFLSYACDPKLDLFAKLRDVIAIARKWTNGGGRSNRQDKFDLKKKLNRSTTQNVIKNVHQQPISVMDGAKSFS